MGSFPGTTHVWKLFKEQIHIYPCIALLIMSFQWLCYMLYVTLTGSIKSSTRRNLFSTNFAEVFNWCLCLIFPQKTWVSESRQNWIMFLWPFTKAGVQKIQVIQLYLEQMISEVVFQINSQTEGDVPLQIWNNMYNIPEEKKRSLALDEPGD